MIHRKFLFFFFCVFAFFLFQSKKKKKITCFLLKSLFSPFLCVYIASAFGTRKKSVVSVPLANVTGWSSKLIFSHTTMKVPVHFAHFQFFFFGFWFLLSIHFFLKSVYCMVNSSLLGLEFFFCCFTSISILKWEGRHGKKTQRTSSWGKV